MDKQTVDAYREKWLETCDRVGNHEERESAWEMYALAVEAYQAITGLDYETPERRKAETPNDT
jgi:hypothetical protein